MKRYAFLDGRTTGEAAPATPASLAGPRIMPADARRGNTAEAVAVAASRNACDPAPKPLACRDMARRSPNTNSAPSDAWPLAALLLLALGLRLVLAATNSGLTMDSPLYVRMAESLRAGEATGPVPAHHGYPLLVALASWLVPGREWPGRVVSLVASLALVACVWSLARQRWSRSTAFAVTAVVALHPLLAVYGGAVMTEATFLALAWGGIAALESMKPRLGGALLGAAWWVRPEAIVVAPLAVLLAPLSRAARVLALVVCIAVALPYLSVLRFQQGHWSLTPKTVLVHAGGANDGEWRLADSTAFDDRVGLTARLARDGGAIAAAWPVRFLAQLRALAGTSGPVLLLLALAGLLFVRTRSAANAFLALPLVYPLLAAPAEPRFVLSLLPALALLAGDAATTALARRAGRDWLVPALLAVAIGVALAEPAVTRRAWRFDDGPMDAMRGAGAWIAAHGPADVVVMDRKSYVAFFAGRRHVQLPDEPLDTVLEHARASGADYLVVEEYVVRGLRPQLAPLLDARALADEPRVRLAYATRPSPGEGVVVLEVVR